MVRNSALRGRVYLLCGPLAVSSGVRRPIGPVIRGLEGLSPGYNECGSSVPWGRYPP